MYEDLKKRLKFFAFYGDKGLTIPPNVCLEAANAIEEMCRICEPLHNPHGRLIDGDVLAAMCDEPHWCVWLSEIEDMPTIIPANNKD